MKKNSDNASGIPEVRIIKRYQNRKLYDTINSCYVTLDEIAQLIKQGEDVRVLDNRTGDDLTSVTLAQIIFEEEKRTKSLLPLATLKNIIQSGGESLVDFFQKSLNTVSSITNVRDEAEKVIDKIKDEFEDGGAFLREIFTRIHKGVDDLQHRIEDKIPKPFAGNLKLPLKGEIRTLRKKLATLERKLRDPKD